MKLKSVVIVPSCFFGGEGDVDGSVDSVVNSSEFLKGDSEVQSAEDADWDNTGDQDHSKTSERESKDDAETSDQEEETDDEETDSSDDDEDAEQSEDDSKFQLPKKQAKEYPDNVMAHFAKRVGATLEQLKGNQPLKNAVKQLVDNAIFAEQRKSEEETETVDDKESTEEATKETVKEPVDSEQEYKAYDERLTKLVQQVNDPRMVDALVRARAQSWGIDPDNKEQMDALKAKGIDLTKQVESDSKAAINLFNTVAPMFMAQWAEAAFPGFGEMYNNALHSKIWDSVRSKTPDLPEYGTSDFNAKIGDVLKANTWIDQMVFTKTGKDGRKVAVSNAEQIQKKYEVAAGLMAGKKPDQKVVDEALETGRREAKKEAAKKSTANPGSRKTNGTFEKASPKLKGSGLGIVEEYEQRKNGF